MRKQEKEGDLDCVKCKVISASVSEANRTDTFSVRYTYFVVLIPGYVVSQESQPRAARSVLLLPPLLLWSRAAQPVPQPLKSFEHFIKSCTSGRFDIFSSIHTDPSNLFFGSKYSLIEFQSFPVWF